MNIVKLSQVEGKQGVCGVVKELYHSEGISISNVEISVDVKKHKHETLEEIYFIIKGKGVVIVGDEEQNVEEGDLIPIPKNVWHAVKKIDGEPLEIMTITNPKYDENDYVFED